MVNDYYSKDADNNEENNKLGMSDVLLNLYAEKEQLLKKIEVANFLNRHLELTENYTTTAFKHMKKEEFIDFVKVSFESECCQIVSAHSDFVKALFNGLVYHDVNELWFEFFNHFSMSIFDIDKLQDLLNYFTIEKKHALHNFSDYKFVDTLLNYILDEISCNTVIDSPSLIATSKVQLV